MIVQCQGALTVHLSDHKSIIINSRYFHCKKSALLINKHTTPYCLLNLNICFFLYLGTRILVFFYEIQACFQNFISNCKYCTRSLFAGPETIIPRSINIFTTFRLEIRLSNSSSEWGYRRKTFMASHSKQPQMEQHFTTSEQG